MRRHDLWNEMAALSHRVPAGVQLLGAKRLLAAQLIRKYIYLYGAVSPKNGTCVYLIMPSSNTACFQALLHMLARKFARHDILLVLDGAPIITAATLPFLTT
jgi:hypothetical protein